MGSGLQLLWRNEQLSALHGNEFPAEEGGASQIGRVDKEEGRPFDARSGSEQIALLGQPNDNDFGHNEQLSQGSGVNLEQGQGLATGIKHRECGTPESA